MGDIPGKAGVGPRVVVGRQHLLLAHCDKEALPLYPFLKQNILGAAEHAESVVHHHKMVEQLLITQDFLVEQVQ